MNEELEHLEDDDLFTLNLGGYFVVGMFAFFVGLL
jgi:hypothetical protein